MSLIIFAYIIAFVILLNALLVLYSIRQATKKEIESFIKALRKNQEF